MSLDITRIRQDFPILGRNIHGHRLVYLDNGATTQKPRAVIDTLTDYYCRYNANVHRGVHRLSEEATDRYEAARATVAPFVGAASAAEIVFTRGTTESINLVAAAWGRANLRRGDVVLVTEMEHHSNIVPWQLAAKAAGASVHAIPITDEGHLDLAAAKQLLQDLPVRLLAVTHVSNVVGTINPVEELADLCHRQGSLLLVDAAQSAPQMPLDAQAMGADFLAFSGHKTYGPTGIGVLWGRAHLLAEMEPYQGGGSMIERVTIAGSTWAAPPARFEAGTPDISGAIGLASALDYLDALDMRAVRAHEREVTAYALEALHRVGGVTVIGPPDADQRGGLVSFTMEGVHPHDISQILDQYGVAVRSGHHCAQPVHDRLGLPATTRAAFGIYNDRDDVDALEEGLAAAQRYFAPPREPAATGVDGGVTS